MKIGNIVSQFKISCIEESDNSKFTAIDFNTICNAFESQYSTFDGYTRKKINKNTESFIFYSILGKRARKPKQIKIVVYKDIGQIALYVDRKDNSIMSLSTKFDVGDVHDFCNQINSEIYRIIEYGIKTKKQKDHWKNESLLTGAVSSFGNRKNN